MFYCTIHTQMFFRRFDECHESALRGRLVWRIVFHKKGRYSALLENDKCSELLGQNGVRGGHGGVGLVSVVN